MSSRTDRYGGAGCCSASTQCAVQRFEASVQKLLLVSDVTEMGSDVTAAYLEME